MAVFVDAVGESPWTQQYRLTFAPAPGFQKPANSATYTQPSGPTSSEIGLVAPSMSNVLMFAIRFAGILNWCFCWRTSAAVSLSKTPFTISPYLIHFRDQSNMSCLFCSCGKAYLPVER